MNTTPKVTRRAFVSRSASAGAGGILLSAAPALSPAETRKGPRDYIIVQGHRDIWELSDRFKISDKSQQSPMRDFLVPRLIEGGVDIVVMPAGGDSVEERDGNQALFEGSMRTLDMLLVEIEKTNGKASIIKTKADLPAQPNKGKVQFFLDLEGGASIQCNEPEPEFHPDRRLALLRQFFRLGVRGMQLTHNGRNMLGDGIAEGKIAAKLSQFGVEVVQEMNRLGMMIGVSHLSAAGIEHVAKITTKPVASTHTNLQRFINTPRQHSDEEVKAIASTGGVIGVRYISNETTPYTLLVEEIDYIATLVGIQHAAIGWEGHDAGHPAPGIVPGYTGNAPTTGIESQTMYQHWDNLIGLMVKKRYTDDQIAMVLGGNFLRIWRQILAA